MSPREVAQVCKAIVARHPNVRQLHVHYNSTFAGRYYFHGGSDAACEAGVDAIGALFAANRLQVLNGSCLRLGDMGAVALSRHIAGTRDCLVALHLTQNSMTNDGMRALRQALLSHTATFRKLSVSCQRYVGVEELLQILGDHPQLNELSTLFWDLREEDAIAVCGAAAQTKRLLTLGMGSPLNEPFSPAYGAALAACAAGKPLRRLSLMQVTGRCAERLHGVLGALAEADLRLVELHAGPDTLAAAAAAAPKAEVKKLVWK
jgi:hypothetical protein